MKDFVLRRLIFVLGITGGLGLASHTFASGFQLWEQDGASVGNYHAGYAALANDASTAWYNPAGITRIKNQQIVFGAAGVWSNFEYQGSVRVSNTVPAPLLPFATRTFNNVSAQGGGFSLVPNLHYVAPINEWIGFGFSVDAPFGLKTDYGNNSPLRFAATKTAITVIDMSPALGVKVNDKGSFGAGFDIQRAYAEFDLAGLATLNGATANSVNKANDTAYGYHLGGLYEFTPLTRAGLSYHSQVVHHLSGNSNFSGPIANTLNGGVIHAGHSTTNLTLPPYTALSGYHRMNDKFAFMGSVIFTQWSTFRRLTLNNVAGVVAAPTPPFGAPSTTIQLSVPEYYRNTWNLSVGADYNYTEKTMLRGGLGYDQTPIKTAYRTVQLPDNNRYVVALGGHYQATKTLGLDVGWTHFFFADARINPPPQVAGTQTTVTNGNVEGYANVVSGQITWDLL